MFERVSVSAFVPTSVAIGLFDLSSNFMEFHRTLLSI